MYNIFTMDEEILEQVEQEKKKRIPKFLKVLMVIFLIIGLLIAAFFFCFYVNDKREVEKDPELKISEYYNDALSKSIDKTKETKAMNFNLKQYVVNSVVSQAVDKVDASIRKFIKNVYILYGDNNEIIININLRFGFFASRISINSTVELYEIEGDENGGIRIRLNEVTIGRVPGFANLLSFIGKKLNLSKLITSALEKVKLHFTINLDTRELLYSYENIRTDMSEIIKENTEEGEGSTKLELFQDLISQFLSDEYTRYELKKNDSLDINLDCTAFAEGVDETKKVKYGLDELKNMVSVLYKKNQHIRMKNILQRLTYFYINGYNRLPPEYQTYISGNIDFSDYTQIPDYRQYKGIETLYSGTDVDTAIDSQIGNSAAIIQKINNGSPIIEINANNISSTIRNKTKIMGYSSVLERVENNSLIYNFMIINDFYCSIKENTTTFYISISLNEYDLNIMFNTTPKQDEEDPYILDFEVNEIYLGSHKIESKTIEDTINTLANNTTDVTFNLKKEDKLTFSIDLSTKLASYKSAIASANKKPYFTVGETNETISISCK